MTRGEILESISAAMGEMFQIDPKTIKPESRLIEDLDLDSIDAIDMAARLQELTGQRLAEDDLRSIRTVSDVVDVAEKLLAVNAEQGG